MATFFTANIFDFRAFANSAKEKTARLLIAAVALLLGLQATPSWALSQTCNAPFIQQSFTNSDPAGTQTGTLQSFTVPARVTSVTIDAAGARGGNANISWAGPGGQGAEVAATITVSPGQVLCALVGVAGGTAAFGGGGGGSFVYAIASGTCASNLSSVTAGSTAPHLLVAAAGGGAGGPNTPGPGGPGRATGLGAGTGGALSGGNGTGGGTGAQAVVVGLLLVLAAAAADC